MHTIAEREYIPGLTEILNDDHQGVELLYKEFVPEMRKFLKKIVEPWNKAEIDDYVQETIIKLIRNDCEALKRLQFAKRRFFKSYLLTCVENTYRSAQRKMEYKVMHWAPELDDDEDNYDAEPTPCTLDLVCVAHSQIPQLASEITENRYAAGLIKAAVGRLSESDQDLVALLAGAMTMKEIAEALGISYAAATSRVNRVRERLKRMIQDDYPDLIEFCHPETFKTKTGRNRTRQRRAA